jgi:hypothetical protein
MSTKLLSALVVSAALMTPGVALADGNNGADVCHGELGDIPDLNVNNPGQVYQGAPGLPGLRQIIMGTPAKDTAQAITEAIKEKICPTPAEPD